MGFVCKLEEQKPRMPGYAVLILAFIAFLCYAVATLVPTTKEMAMIKAIPAVVNSDTAKTVVKDASELYKLGIEAAKAKFTGGADDNSK